MYAVKYMLSFCFLAGGGYTGYSISLEMRKCRFKFKPSHIKSLVSLTFLVQATLQSHCEEKLKEAVFCKLCLQRECYIKALLKEKAGYKSNKYV